jgi:NAD(P)H-nitrite reductase large subunit
MLCTYVNTLMEENARVEHTSSTVLVSHLADSDVVNSCFDVTQGTWRPR